MPKKLTFDDFVTKARNTHGNKYDYSKVSFNTITDKVIIICPEHGEFTQQAWAHANNNGCFKCGNKKKTGVSNVLTTEEFIDRAKNIHGDKYKYDKAQYYRYKSPVVITCPTHGDFEITPSNHILGGGCQKCSHPKSLGSNFEGHPSKYKNTPGCVYLYRFYDQDSGESFNKVGVTRKPIEKRFMDGKYKNLDFQYINSIWSSFTNSLLIEQCILNEFVQTKYEPSRDFSGKTECFSLSAENQIDELLSLIKDTLK